MRFVAVGAGLLAVIAVLFVVLLDDGQRAAADVRVERDGSRVMVSISHVVSADDIRRALDRAGVHITVTTKITGPSLRYRFVSIVGPADAHLGGGSTDSSLTASFSVGSKVELFVGGAPDDPSQPYEIPTDATAVGEPLAGLTVRGRTVDELRPLIAPRVSGMIIGYQTSDGQQVSAPRGDSVVDGAQTSSERKITVYLR